jgi:hypothetical protein
MEAPRAKTAKGAPFASLGKLPTAAPRGDPVRANPSAVRG